MNYVCIKKVFREINKRLKGDIKLNNIEIRETTINDYTDIIKVHKDAFGIEGEIIAGLVTDLLEDESGKPLISLLATSNGESVGHILFTKAKIDNDENNLSAYILAPLGISQKFQNAGIGGKLIAEGVEKLKKLNTDLIFVLGYPTYYTKYGFINNAIGEIGYEATYPIPEKNYDAWMYMNLISIENVKKNPGRVICADSMNKIEYWIE